MKLALSKVLKITKYLIFLLAVTIFTIEIGFRVVRNAGWFGLDYGDVIDQQVMNEGGYLLPHQDVLVTNGYGD